MKTYRILIFCVVILFLLMNAGNSVAVVTGTVTDTSGEPVSGATVTFTDESNPDNRFSDITDAQGNYEIEISGVYVTHESAPEAFSLGQNYPNPFNPTTTIPYMLGKAGNVRIDIFTITGQRVWTLVDEYRPAGSFTVVWDACDDDGNPVSAGVYIYRLQTAGGSEAHKMLLLDGGYKGMSGGEPSASHSMAMHVSKKLTATWCVEITANDIESYTERDLVLSDGERYDFVVTRLSGTTIHNGITFIYIPGGTFQMGDEVGNLHSGCRPVHTVTVSPFEMSVYEVTNARYTVYLNEALESGDISATRSDVKGARGDFNAQDYIYLAGNSTSKPDNDCKIIYSNGSFSVKTGYENWPVIWVTWYGAKSFALHYGFDLPSEAEWEYACRGGKQYKYGTDDGTFSTSKVNCWDNGIRHPVAVGSYPANPFGLYDMSGNVWEWCNDWYVSYPSGSMKDQINVQVNSFRVTRGGSWGDGDINCRSAFRLWSKPNYKYNYGGFRVVRR